MSEFSESYHLLTKDQNEGVTLLNNANLKGFVFPSNDEWVTILAENKIPFVPNESLINSNDGLLVHFFNAEDHGWKLGIYKNKIKTCGYECYWDEDIQVNDKDLNMNIIKDLIRRKEVSDASLESIFYPKDLSEIFSNESPANKMAELLGLNNYEWMSYEYFAYGEGMLERFENIITVK